VEEAVPLLGTRLLEAGHLRAVHDVDVEPAVTVVVEHGNPGDHRFRLMPPGGSAGPRHESKTALGRLLLEDDGIEGGGGVGRLEPRRREEREEEGCGHPPSKLCGTLHACQSGPLLPPGLE
jgi:hypothetical protein